MRAAFIVATLSSCALYGETIDRIAVSVDKQVITESAILLDRRVSSFLDSVPIDLSGEAKRKSAERLVDQLLILREAADSRIKLPTAAQAQALVMQVKQQRGTEEAYREALKEYGISESNLAAHLLAGLIAYTFSELRFRPSVQNTEDDLRMFFNNIKAPGTFEENREELEEVLTRQRTEDALDAWLIEARASSRIQFREAVFQ